MGVLLGEYGFVQRTVAQILWLRNIAMLKNLKDTENFNGGIPGFGAKIGKAN